jgi:uncharacterized protein involved in outer membrane biogenesis
VGRTFLTRFARIALGAGAALLVAAAVLAAVFLWGVAVPGEFLRAPLERALTAAFGVPTRIEGPLRLRTGRSATATADALVLADPSGPAGATLARGIRPAVRIDLGRLLRRVVALDEVTGERLELTVVRAADGRLNWAAVFATTPDSGPPPVAFAGIARLRIGAVAGSYRGAAASPVEFTVATLDGALPLRDATTARGTAQVAGHAIAFDLRTASLEGLRATAAGVPVQGTLGWSGAHLALDGKVAPDGSRLDAKVEVTAEDAAPLLDAVGVATRSPGRLEARTQLGVTATEATAADLMFALGKSGARGSMRLAWGASRPRVTIDAAGGRIDLEPFLAADAGGAHRSAAEALVEALERAAGAATADVKLAAAELTGLPVALRELELTARVDAGTVAVRGQGELSGTRAKLTLDYDARKAERVLVARIDAGAVSTARLPPGARSSELAGSSAGIRGEARGQGADPRALVASLQASLDARDLRWTLAARDGKPLSGRFDTVRIVIQGTRASSAEVAGTLGDANCALKVSGGALKPLLERSPWPLQLAGTCPGGRLSAKGRIALAERHVGADLAFDASADRIGPIAQALGVAPTAPHPFAARGSLALDEKVARVRLDALRLGRSAGAGQVELPLGGGGTPRVQLRLTAADLDELGTLFPGASAAAPTDALARAVLPAALRLPELEFDLAADTLRVGGEALRRVQTKGVTRDGHLPRTPIAFAWGGAQAAANIAVDFRGASPAVELDGTAGNADLGALLARLGQPGTGLRAGQLVIRARAAGVRLGELLADATLDVAIERGQLRLARAPAPGLAGPAEFSASLKAAPGQPTAAAASGTIGGDPFDLALDAPGLAALARARETLPLTLRATLGDARLQGAGKVARDGTGEGRVELSGDRLDRLGKLAGAALPAVGPYAARGTVVVTADAIRGSDLDVSFGKSRLLGKGEIQSPRAGRARHSAALRAPALHLEDIGGARWLGGPEREVALEAPAAREREAELARLFAWLRGADVDASLEVDALHGGAERFASGRLRASLTKGVLRARLEDVKTADGTIDADLGVDASGAQPKVAVRARVAGLAFGPLARTLDPATKLGGRVDLVADLAAQGPPGRLLPALAGTLDVAVFPHDLSAEALAFWGTGLLGALLRSLDPNTRSEVECAVASLEIAGGVASTSAFFVDTTRVRIVGQIDANFVTRALSGRIRPVSEQPELFTVAPTMQLGGTIESPRLTVAPENVVLAPLRFATPLAGFALDFLNAKGQLREGVAGCREAYERARKLRARAALR